MERGPRYDLYAQLRESNLQSKRLKLDEDEQVSEIPISEYSPPVKKSDESHGNLGSFKEVDRVSALPEPGFLKKSMKFHGISNDCEENVQVFEIPKSEYSPILKKSAKFHQNLYTFDENERVSPIPRPDFLKKSVRFHGVSTNSEQNVQICEIPRSEYSPPMKKPMKFHGNSGRKQGYSVLAQSVPDFSSVLRKENRKPTPESGNVSRNPTVQKTETPPLSMVKRGRIDGSVSKYGGGSKSVNSGEKQSSVRMIMGRKSYASIQELKGLSIVAANAINGENKRGRKSAVFSTSTKYY